MALCMVLGTATLASALEVQVSGVWDTSFRFNDNLAFNEDDVRDHFEVRSRFRPQVEFIASENIRGVLQMQIGSIKWGDKDSGGALDTTNTSARVRRAYIDWNVADTSLNVKMGLQHLAFPSAVRGNPFFGANVAGVIASVSITDEINVSGFWARPHLSTGYNNDYKDNQTDLFGIIADFDFDTFSISPWVAYSKVGNASGFWEYGDNFISGGDLKAGAFGFDDDADVFAGGIAVKVVPFENLTIGFDGAYATMDNDGRGKKYANQAPEGDGYFFALSVDYALDWGTPGIFGWYSSGDSKSDRRKGKFGRMMTMGPDDGVAFTRLGFTGSFGHGMDSIVGYTGAGTWGVGLQIADISFIEKLSHTVRVAYYEGTNAKLGDPDTDPVAVFGESVYMTRKDYAIEANLDSQYQIYENFTAVLELGYIYMDLDKNGFEYNERNGDVDENAWQANLIFRYAF